jgi:hypothetical protein
VICLTYHGLVFSGVSRFHRRPGDVPPVVNDQGSSSATEAG